MSNSTVVIMILFVLIVSVNFVITFNRNNKKFLKLVTKHKAIVSDYDRCKIILLDNNEEVECVFGKTCIAKNYSGVFDVYHNNTMYCSVDYFSSSRLKLVNILMLVYDVVIVSAIICISMKVRSM